MFSVHKCTEPIQPQASFSFPKIYQAKPSIGSHEATNAQNQGSANPTSDAELKNCNQATDPEEVFTLPCQGSRDETPCITQQTGAMTSSCSISYPKLHFSISLHKHSGELCINIVEAENISVEAGCEGYISGSMRVSEEHKHAQTAVRKMSPHMHWAEELVFTLPMNGTEDTDSLEGEVALSLHCCDRFSHNSTLGMMRFKLADVSMMLDADCWVDLQPPKQLKKKQTRRVKHKMNPVWNEMMMLELPSELLPKSSVDLEVLNLACSGTLFPLGRCVLGLHSSGTGLQHWKQMLDNPRKQIAMWHPLY
ncbi:hypothetical protein DNTS_002483 [Danionella cerebrum]|uniref:C2 domain-containing protein n=1 Tax=Danionella cerebrum TaxID=2873325 RepID=A0A553PXI7_9TELE|nr:hypothetical protein DNTS_002483 [Danionella translucida]